MGVSQVELVRLQARDEMLRIVQGLSRQVAAGGGQVLVADARRNLGLNDLLDSRRLCHWAAGVLLLDRARTRAGEVYRVQRATQRGVRPNFGGNRP